MVPWHSSYCTETEPLKEGVWKPPVRTPSPSSNTPREPPARDSVRSMDGGGSVSDNRVGPPAPAPPAPLPARVDTDRDRGATTLLGADTAGWLRRPVSTGDSPPSDRRRASGSRRDWAAPGPGEGGPEDPRSSVAPGSRAVMGRPSRVTPRP